jgi:6-pyruvoyltetrahydropterin/6-carboxytetrahydropterin synthase
LNAQGMVMDFADLKEICNQVVDPLDHSMLNELPAFTENSPTAERLAQYLFDALWSRLKDAAGGRVALDYVTVCESERSCATYRR